MHTEAFAFVARSMRQHAWTGDEEVVEVGARNINGSIRPLFVHARRYVGIDVVAGDGVDVVASGETYRHDAPIDIALCCEVLEHTEKARAIVENLLDQLSPTGKLILTTAGPERVPHSAVDGGLVRAGEHYANLTADAIAECLSERFDAVIETGRDAQDVYAVISRRPVTYPVEQATVEIWCGVPNARDQLLLNMTDLTDFVRGFSIDYDVGGPPTITITLVRGTALKMRARLDATIKESST